MNLVILWFWLVFDVWIGSVQTHRAAKSTDRHNHCVWEQGVSQRKDASFSPRQAASRSELPSPVAVFIAFSKGLPLAIKSIRSATIRSVFLNKTKHIGHSGLAGSLRKPSPNRVSTWEIHQVTLVTAIDGITSVFSCFKLGDTLL